MGCTLDRASVSPYDKIWAFGAKHCFHLNRKPVTYVAAIEQVHCALLSRTRERDFQETWSRRWIPASLSWPPMNTRTEWAWLRTPACCFLRPGWRTRGLSPAWRWLVQTSQSTQLTWWSTVSTGCYKSTIASVLKCLACAAGSTQIIHHNNPFTDELFMYCRDAHKPDDFWQGRGTRDWQTYQGGFF